MGFWDNPNHQRYEDKGKTYTSGDRDKNKKAYEADMASEFNRLTGPLPGEDAFYSGQIARAQRALGAQFQGLRSAHLQSLEARNLGQSSEVSRTLQGLAMDQGQRLDDVIGDVGAQQFSARQQRVNAYLSYLYQKKLKAEDSKFDPFSFLLQAGQAAGNLYANRGGGDPYAVTNVSPYNPGGSGGGGYG